MAPTQLIQDAVLRLRMNLDQVPGGTLEIPLDAHPADWPPGGAAVVFADVGRRVSVQPAQGGTSVEVFEQRDGSVHAAKTFSTTSPEALADDIKTLLESTLISE